MADRFTIADLDALDDVPAPLSATKFAVADLDALDAKPAVPVTAAAAPSRAFGIVLPNEHLLPGRAHWGCSGYRTST